MNHNKSRQSRIREQVGYYARHQPVRIKAEDSPYVLRHFDEVIRQAGLTQGEHVCEWGAGQGRFSRQFLQRGCRLTAIELSGRLASECARTISPWPEARLLIGDILEASADLEAEFDLIAGFFVLHHLPDLDSYFLAARKMLRRGGRMVFVEPNPFNPLYPVQILLTPDMEWEQEAGIYRLWPQQLSRAAAKANFQASRIYRYGALPRAPYNLLSRWGLERVPEWLTPRFLRPFTVFTAHA